MLYMYWFRLHPLRFSACMSVLTRSCVAPCVLNTTLMPKQGALYNLPSYRHFRVQTDTLNWSEVFNESVSGDILMSREEAMQFLQNSWNIKMNDVESQLKTDRESFLNKLIQTSHEKIPYQLLSFFNHALLPPNERKLPSFEEIKQMCMSGLGGGCFSINIFIWHLLKALGYSAHLRIGKVTSTDLHSHLLIIVKDLVNTGDIHLVDCGLGQPSFRATSLNFNEESPVYQESYLEYKYIKHDGKILRMHGEGDLVRRNDPPIEGFDLILGKWRRFYEFYTLEDFEQETFLKYLKKLGDTWHSDPQYLSPRALRYPAGKAVIIRGRNLLLEQEDKRLKKIKLESTEEILKAYWDYFPSIDKKLVQHVYSIWQKNRL